MPTNGTEVTRAIAGEEGCSRALHKPPRVMARSELSGDRVKTAARGINPARNAPRASGQKETPTPVRGSGRGRRGIRVVQVRSRAPAQPSEARFVRRYLGNRVKRDAVWGSSHSVRRSYGNLLSKGFFPLRGGSEASTLFSASRSEPSRYAFRPRAVAPPVHLPQATHVSLSARRLDAARLNALECATVTATSVWACSRNEESCYKPLRTRCRWKPSARRWACAPHPDFCRRMSRTANALALGRSPTCHNSSTAPDASSDRGAKGGAAMTPGPRVTMR